MLETKVNRSATGLRTTKLTPERCGTLWRHCFSCIESTQFIIKVHFKISAVTFLHPPTVHLSFSLSSSPSPWSLCLSGLKSCSNKACRIYQRQTKVFVRFSICVLLSFTTITPNRRPKQSLTTSRWVYVCVCVCVLTLYSISSPPQIQHIRTTKHNNWSYTCTDLCAVSFTHRVWS